MFMRIVYWSAVVLCSLSMPNKSGSTTMAAIAAYQTNDKIEFKKIKDVKVNTTVYTDMGQNTPQLLVSWTDDLPNSTSYNVLVTALDTTHCTEYPCSLMGVSKPKKELIMPAQPMLYLADPDCTYKFGCDYTVRVETSNAAISKSTNVSIPQCFLDSCDCMYTFVPAVIIVATVPQNDTVQINWSIKLDADETQKPLDVLERMQAATMHLDIKERTNPSLLWGGRHEDIMTEEYQIRDLEYIYMNETMRGDFEVKLPMQLPPKAELHLDAYLTDQANCQGPYNATKVRVPGLVVVHPVGVRNELDLRITLIIITAFFLTAIVSALAFAIWRRRQKKSQSVHKDNLCLSPFSAIIEMEDNINYVDKDVEEAQAKGLADIFEVPHHAIQLGPEIGEGAFGRVYKATATNLRRMRGTMLVAVKQLKKNPTADEVEEFLSEIEMLKGVGTHHNIVCFLGCCTIRSPYLMVMEYVGRGDLLSYLRTVRYEAVKFQPPNANHNTNHVNNVQQHKTNSNSTPAVKYIELKMSTQSIDSDAETETRQPMPSFAETTYTIIEDDDEYNEPFQYILDHKELHNFALQIANGMRFLEEQEITHRDLAARNVLIDDRKTLKISDFGLSRHGIYTNTKTRKLPLRWLSIEAIRDNVYSSQSDVWAYGVVLWEIGTLGASPYPTISNHDLIPFLLSGRRLEKPDICTDQVYALMLECWDEDPAKRPTFEELYKALSPKSAYVDINSLSDDYVFPPIKDKETTTGYLLS